MTDFVMDDGDPTAPEGGKPAKRNRRDERALLLAGIEFWCTDDGTSHASLPHPKGHLEHVRIASRDFANHLRVKNLQASGAGLSGNALADLVADAEAKALASGDVRTAWRRYAVHQGEIWVDLGGRDPGGERRAVRITAETWCIVPARDVPVCFLRGPNALALSEPERGAASWGDLGQFINAGTDHDLTLIWAWALCAARQKEGRGQYPILLLHGEQGSGKTEAARMLEAMIDPSQLTGRTMPRDPGDIWITAGNRHLLSFDNVSTISGHFADDIAPLATHGSYTKKKLYTNDEEWTVSAARPLCFAGIPGTLLNRNDLADRAIAIELRPLEKRGDLAKLLREFQALRPALLGLLYDGLSAGLRNLPETTLARGPRMFDSCLWAEACAPGLGIEPGVIPEAWIANRSQADSAALEADDVAQAVVRFLKAQMPEKIWKGSASNMLAILKDREFDLAKAPHWPRSALALGVKLRRLAPSLRATYQIDASQGKEGAAGTRYWLLKKSGDWPPDE